MQSLLPKDTLLRTYSNLRDSTVFIFNIYWSIVHFQFSPNMAGFPDILNYFRHNRVCFGTGKTLNFRAQRHLYSDKTGVQTGIRVENSLDQDQVQRFVRV